MNEPLKKILNKMQYRLINDTAAVQICRWTKNKLRGDRGCWKEKFYGIDSARCCEMTPNVMNCENKCLHCWRPIEFNLGTKTSTPIKPKELLDKIIEERTKLLYGFGGNKNVNKAKLQNALTPSLFTLSLSGEPTLYPYLGGLFKEIRKRNAVSFLVTNGQNPNAIKKLKKDELPTQIAVSTNAPNKKLFDIWHRSCKKNAWNEFLKTLKIIAKLKGKTRRAIRLTLVKPGKTKSAKYNALTNMSDKNITEYAKLIKIANPDFVHVKGFKSVGYSRERFGYDKQPWYEDILDFAEKLNSQLKDYTIAGKDERCCVVILSKKGTKLKIERA